MKQVHYLINKKNPNYGRPLTTHELRALVESGKVRNHATVETHYSDGSKWYGSVYAVLDEYFWYLSPRQRAYLKFLGYTGSMYITQDDCHHAIETLKKINPNGVDGLDYDDLVDQECNNYNDDCTFDDDTFKEAADNYVFYQKNDFDSLPPELQPPRLSTVVTEIIKVERIASIAGGIVGLIENSRYHRRPFSCRSNLKRWEGFDDERTIRSQ